MQLHPENGGKSLKTAFQAMKASCKILKNETLTAKILKLLDKEHIEYKLEKSKWSSIESYHHAEFASYDCAHKAEHEASTKWSHHLYRQRPYLKQWWTCNRRIAMQRLRPTYLRQRLERSSAYDGGTDKKHSEKIKRNFKVFQFTASVMHW